MPTIKSITSSILDQLNSAASSSSTSTAATTTTSTTNNTAKTTSLGSYLESTPKSELDTKEMFKKLSIDVGGDGKTITKDQLDNYITKAEKGKVNISDEELNSLQDLQDNWDNIAQGGDSITYANMSQNKDILTSMAPEETTTTTDWKTLATDSTAQAYEYIVQSALGTSTGSTPSASSYSSLLNTLLTGTTDKNDDANAELISKLTNLIAQSKNKSTIETEA